MDRQTLDQRLDKIESLLQSQKTILNLREACDFTGLSRSYMYKLTHLGRIPCYKPDGKLIYFDRAELEAWLKRNPVKTAEQTDREAAGRVTLGK